MKQFIFICSKGTPFAIMNVSSWIKRSPTSVQQISYFKRAMLSFDTASTVVKDIWDAESNSAQSMCFMLYHLCQPLLLTEAVRDHRIMRPSSRHFVLRLEDQSARMYDASRCKCAAERRPTVSHETPLQTVHAALASSQLIFSLAFPAACSDHTGRSNGTHCIFQLTIRGVFNI